MSEHEPLHATGAAGVGCLPRDLLLAARADAAPREARDRVLAALARALAPVTNEASTAACPLEGAASVPVSTSSGVFEKQSANVARHTPASGCTPSAGPPVPPLPPTTLSPTTPLPTPLPSTPLPPKPPRVELAEQLTWSVSPAPSVPWQGPTEARLDLGPVARCLGATVRAIHRARVLPLAAAVLIGVLVGNGIYRLATLAQAERRVAAEFAILRAAVAVPTDASVVERPTRAAVRLDAPGSAHPTGKGKRSLGGARARPAQPCAVAALQRRPDAVPHPPPGRAIARRAAREDWLGEQLALLARAERNLVEGDARLALRSLDEYATRFPAGMLDPQMAWLRERVDRTFDTYIFP